MTSMETEGRIFKAIKFAAKAHEGQFRKGTNIPYFVHPMAVLNILMSLGFSEDIAIAGLLHDTVEDTKATYEEISASFGNRVSEIVRGASEPDKSDTWENRKKHTIEFLKQAPMDVVIVSCADKLDNIQSIRNDLKQVGEEIWKRFKRSREQQRWYYQSLREVFKDRMKEGREKTLFDMFEQEVSRVFNK